MKRATLLLVALLVAGASGSVGGHVAAAKGPEPGVVYASAVLALVGGEIEQPKLVWLNPRTLKRIGREAVPLGREAHSPVLSPTGGRVAVGGSSADGIRIADVYRMKLLSRLARRSGSWTVAPIAWPDDRRLLALEWNNRVDGEADIAVVDPAARKVLRRTPLGGYAGSVATSAGPYVLAVGGPAKGIGPARVLVVGESGVTRSLVLDRIPAGGEQDGPDEETWRTASPGVAVDSNGRRAYVVGQAPLVAEIDLDSLAVTYRELSQPVSLLGRLRNWLEPTAGAKAVAGWSRQAVLLGDGVLAVTGTDYDGLRSTPSGLQLIDVRAGTVRTLEPGASFALAAGGMLLASGAESSGDASKWSGMGLAAYTPDGTRLWRILPGEPVSWLQAAGGYGYVAGPVSYPSTVRIIDLGTGAVRTVRGQLPFIVTP